MDKDAGAGWRYWGPVIVKVTVDLCPGRELGVEAGCPKEIEGEKGLGKQLVP